MDNDNELNCVSKPNSSDKLRCIIQLKQLVPYFTTYFKKRVTSVTFSGPNGDVNNQKLTVEFESSTVLLHRRYSVRNLTVRKLQCSWQQLSTLARHFKVEDNYFPTVSENSDVYTDLELTVNFNVQGLKLLTWSLPDDEKTDEQNLSTVGTENVEEPISPMEGMETIASFVLHYGVIEHNEYSFPPVSMLNMFRDNYTVPKVLTSHLWPELKYLELEVTEFNVTHVELLKKNVPKLNYLKLYVPFDNIPDVIWTYDWDLLPWRVGFVAVHTDPQDICDENLDLDLRNTIVFHRFPPVHFYDSVQRRGTCSNYVKLNLNVDFGHNNLDSLGYFQFTFGDKFNIKLDISHNNLTSVDLVRRFHVTKHATSSTCDGEVVAKVRMLDLTFNQLDDSDEPASDFLLFEHLKELYLHHNYFTNLPRYRMIRNGLKYDFRIKDLQELNVLDMSHNFLQSSNVNFDELSFDEFSPIKEIYFHHNFFTRMPAFLYKAKYLTHADFSYNMIRYYEISPYQPTLGISTSGTEHTIVRLDENLISEQDLSALDPTHIPRLHNAMNKFDIYLDGNPIKCNCKSYSMFEYLISSSLSLRQNDTNPEPLDFSFYETEWKCVYPTEWAGIPMMQISEYEYDSKCKESLKGCPKYCYCYHTWKLGKIIVANCSHDSSADFTHFPETIPSETSLLVLSHNCIRMLCDTRSYFEDLLILDLSWNDLNIICPGILGQFRNLTELNLSYNKWKELPSDIAALENLKVLQLVDSYLKALPESITTMNNLLTIDISGNVLRCDCDTFWMTKWLINSMSVFTNPHVTMCFSGKGRGKRLIDLHQDDVGCYDPLEHALIGLGVSVVLVGVFSILIFKYRGILKIWLYTRFGFHPWDKGDDLKEKDYDAFVSYCNKDLKWVAGTLLPYLEAPQCGFHLCVHERDFVPGVAITKNITTAIEYSRRTILVLSPDFIKSGWCDLEFQIAHQRALEDRSNFLIVVLLQEVDSKELDETLRFYMKTRTYISADDKWFWQKMLYALPNVPIDQVKSESGSPRQQITSNISNNFQKKINSFSAKSNSEDGKIDTNPDCDQGKSKIFRRISRSQFIAELPPLFKRINSYNDALES